MDSFRFVVCARAECGQVFFLCRRCDRGDRYCSRGCTHRARHGTLQAAGRRYQRSWRGRVHHAARQARYRHRREKVTHQTSPECRDRGIVFAPSPAPVSPCDGQEVHPHATPRRVAAPPRCARCGRPGRWVRHVTLAHCRPRPTPRR